MMRISELLPPDQIEAFCQRWPVARLEAFGSVLRDDFGPDSDIDLLVTFNSAGPPHLIDFITMQLELSEIAGRRVDLVSRYGIEHGRNQVIKNKILSSAEPIYAK